MRLAQCGGGRRTSGVINVTNTVVANVIAMVWTSHMSISHQALDSGDGSSTNPLDYALGYGTAYMYGVLSLCTSRCSTVSQLF
jgi:hypothetical protein